MPLLLVRQRLAGQRPADSAIAQGMDRVRHAGVDQRLVPMMLRVRPAQLTITGVCGEASGSPPAGPARRRAHADAAGDAHGLVLIEAPGVDDHHLLSAVDERLNPSWALSDGV